MLQLLKSDTAVFEGALHPGEAVLHALGDRHSEVVQNNAAGLEAWFQDYAKMRNSNGHQVMFKELQGLAPLSKHIPNVFLITLTLFMLPFCIEIPLSYHTEMSTNYTIQTIQHTEWFHAFTLASMVSFCVYVRTYVCMYVCMYGMVWYGMVVCLFVCSLIFVCLPVCLIVYLLGLLYVCEYVGFNVCMRL